MRNLNEHNVTEVVLQQMEGTRDPRLKSVMACLVRHLHAFFREAELSEEEWFAAVRFLAEMNGEEDFIRLSNVLGATALQDAIIHRKPPGVTQSSVLGPFFREGAKELENGGNLAAVTEGDPTFFAGRVTTSAGEPIAGALLDIWQNAPNALYENQDDDQPDMNLRCKLRADKNGAYAFRTIRPVSYPIPNRGPVGRLLKALGRHHYRPAHMHFKVAADGYVPLTTALFALGDPYLDSDAVYGVKETLVIDFVRHDSPEEAVERGVAPPFYTVDYDFKLVPLGG